MLRTEAETAFDGWLDDHAPMSLLFHDVGYLGIAEQAFLDGFNAGIESELKAQNFVDEGPV